MNSTRAVSVLMNSDLLTLSRACAVLRRRNMPVRGFAVASQSLPDIWRLTCEIDADDATAENLVLLI
jgi:acetolactate synthase small subunit